MCVGLTCVLCWVGCGELGCELFEGDGCLAGCGVVGRGVCKVSGRECVRVQSSPGADHA